MDVQASRTTLKTKRAARDLGSPGTLRPQQWIAFWRKQELVGDGRGRSVELRDGNRELLVVSGGSVPKNAEGDGLAEKDGLVGVAAVMDAGVDAVTEADVVSDFGQFAVHSQSGT